MITAMRCDRWVRSVCAALSGRYPVAAITDSTRSRVAARTRCGALITFDTVCSDTEAALATSAMVGRWCWHA